MPLKKGGWGRIVSSIHSPSLTEFNSGPMLVQCSGRGRFRPYGESMKTFLPISTGNFSPSSISPPSLPLLPSAFCLSLSVPFKLSASVWHSRRVYIHGSAQHGSIWAKLFGWKIPPSVYPSMTLLLEGDIERDTQNQWCHIRREGKSLFLVSIPTKFP